MANSARVREQEQLSFGLRRIWEEGARLPRLSQQGKALHQVRQAWRGFVTSPLTSVVTVLTIAVSLLMLAAFILLIENMAGFVSRTQTDLNLSLYLTDDAAPEAVEKIMAELKSYPEVGKVSYIDKQTALSSFRKSLGQQASILDGLEDTNPLPASLEVVFSGKEFAETVFARFSEQYESHAVVEYVQYSQGLMNQLGAALRRLRTGGAIAIFFTLLMTGFIISNTIQLALFSRRAEIEIMRLVGATDRFICAPYMIEGFFQGLVGAIVGLVLLYGLQIGLDGLLNSVDLTRFMDSQLSYLSLSSIILVICVGFFVGIGGSYLAVRRFSHE